MHKYVKATSGSDLWSLEDTNTDGNCKFMFYWATGTGPVMPTPNATMTNAYYILTSGGKALVGSATAPFLSWAALDVGSIHQMFYFHAVSGPTISSETPFVYNLLCMGVPGKVYCFDDNNTISTRPEADAGEWEKLAIEMGPSSLPEYFSRFKVTGMTFLARLRADADTTGSVTLADKYSLETIEDFFFVLPVGTADTNPKDTEAPTKAASNVFSAETTTTAPESSASPLTTSALPTRTAVAPPDALSEVVASADRPLNVSLSGGACPFYYDSATRRPNGSPAGTSPTAPLLLALLACSWLWVAHY
eukprot:GILJ01010932.1.p1 GENE.GILJ01010932.1~~GILJ01010932.1.p1  ORF type:complete len:306 (-),score=47.26 GILJ01010932.1:159-1076(-)